jgi:hypothetical protein
MSVLIAALQFAQFVEAKGCKGWSDNGAIGLQQTISTEFSDRPPPRIN